MGNEAIINEGGLQNAQRVACLQLTHLNTVTLLRLREKQCFLKVLSFSDNFLMEESLRKLKIRVSKFKECAHILNVYQVSKQERNQLCTNNYQLHIYMEYFEQTLAQSIQKRLEERRNYTEQDLYSVLTRAVDSLIYIQDNGLKTIHLDADAIVFSGDQLKILDGGVAFSKEYYHLLNEKQKNIRHKQHNIYLAPELLKQLKELNYEPYVSPKADIFSLGMILLQMITLQSMNCYYDYHKATIDYDSLIHRLSRISHSLPLKTLLAEMLEQDPEIRIGLVSLKEKLQKVNNPSLEQQSIIRSRSSKMLKEILSNSRKSSIGKQEASAKRDSSKDRKSHEQYASNTSRNKQASKYSVNDSEKGMRRSEIGEQLRNKAEEFDLKNIVKNKLKKDRNKQNPNSQHNPKIPNKYLQESSRQTRSRTLRDPAQQKQLFQSNTSNHFDIDCNKSEASRQSRDCENSISVKNSLCRLVQESSLKNLLNLQSVNVLTSNNFHSQRVSESTSRFPSFDISDQVKRSDTAMPVDGNLNVFQQKKAKVSQIYVKQQEQILSKDASFQDLQFNTQSVGDTKLMNKGMTFNNKQFGLIARSVQATVEDFEQYTKKQQKLIFSPIQSAERQQLINGHNQSGSSQSFGQTQQVIVRSIPVIPSQEKVCMTRANSIKNNLGKVQRKLQTGNHVEPSSKIKVSEYRSKINNSDKVTQTDNLNQLTRKTSQKLGQNCAFFKKTKSKQTQINIEEQQRQKQNTAQKDVKSSQSRQAYFNLPQLQTQSGLKSVLDVMSKTSRSIQQQEQAKMKNTLIASPFQPHIKNYSHSTPNIVGSCINQNTYNAAITSQVNQILLSNGDIYQGEINSQGQMHGNGIIYSQGKVKFNGYFKNDKFNGSGTLYNLSCLSLPVDYHFVDLSRPYWTKYEGDFQNGFKSGFGKIYFVNGDRLAGSIKKDMIEGWACFYPKNGQPVSGWWMQNRFQAPGL